MNRQLSTLFVVLILLFLLPTFPTQQAQAQAVLPDIVLSQVYGGGGTAVHHSATILLNFSTAAQPLCPWLIGLFSMPAQQEQGILTATRLPCSLVHWPLGSII